MKTKLLIFFIWLVLLLPLSSYGAVLSQGWQPTSNYGGFGLPDASVTEIVLNFALFILYLISTFAVIAFAVSGIQYLTSAGSESQIETAKRNMKYSIVGTIVAMSGLIIVQEISSMLGLCIGWWCTFWSIFGSIIGGP